MAIWEDDSLVVLSFFINRLFSLATGVQPQDKPDQTLVAGMVVNVDMPHTEIGWGSVHMEDTVVITDDGCERLTTADFSMRII